MLMYTKCLFLFFLKKLLSPLMNIRLAMCMEAVCRENLFYLEKIKQMNLFFSSGEFCLPILPWISGDGEINKAIYKGLRRRVLGIVMQNPGILEVEIINQMDVLNPQL